jgi:penicillin-binding protein 2
MPQGPPQRDKDTRFGVLAAIGLAGFFVLVLGLMHLQVLQHDELKRLADQNRIRLDVLRAPRGVIRDRMGRVLADNQPSFDIVFRPAPIESTLRVRTVVASDWLARVAGALDSDTLEVKRKVREANRTGQTAVLRRTAPFAVLVAVEELRTELPGLDVQVAPIRRYPEGSLAAQLLGYAGEINDRELAERADKGYTLGDLIGKTGVERRYEEVLRGEDGAEFVVVNAMGKRVTTLDDVPPKPPVAGRDVTLTLDLDVQNALEEAMSGIERGAAVALDPRDGSVLAMVSKPVFDPNEFSKGISFARWRQLNSNGAYPLLNRAIQSSYPPGSTFKIVTMLAALNQGLVTAQTHEPTSCTGGYFFGGRRFGCWKKEGHGNLDMVGALQHSCDVFFYQLSLRLGLDPLERTARATGLGEKTGIDLPSESRGLVPGGAYYDERFQKGRWPRGLLLNLGIGQGELLTTPLQLATMTAVVANNGRPVRPHVVSGVQGVPTFRVEPPVEPGVNAAPASWEAVHLAMRKVVEAGTAGAVRIPGLPVAGKTGTAQNPHGDDHALFVCYAPAVSPTIALAVVAENSGHGGSVSAPIAAHVLKRLFLRDSTAAAPRPPAFASADTVGD